MGRGVGSLVQRRYPHGGTHLANGGLVPLLARAPALGLGSGPPGRVATQALLCTDLAVEPAQILEWFALRWQLEVTFQEVHLGVETQRQWSGAIARTTPARWGSSPGPPWRLTWQEQRPMSHRTAVVRQAVDHRSGAPPLVAGDEGFSLYGKSRLPCTTDLDSLASA